MKINKEVFFSPATIFILYVIAASLFILGFHFIFPGEVAPLPIFAHDWRLIRALLDFIALFPALALSALVVPFGIASDENYYTSFSQHLFDRLKTPLITAICAAALYALLFFLILPLTETYEENLRFKGEVYHQAKERAQAHQETDEWHEVARLIGICQGIWPNSPEIAFMQADLNAALEKMLFEEDAYKEPAINLNPASVSALPGQGEPLDATEAIALSELALLEERPFDAHWLATLGVRLAKAGSPESKQAAELAAKAWNQIEAQHPTATENQVYSIYKLKLSGYEAMVSGDWIRAYYIFKDLLELTPFDPDARHFFTASEKGTREKAFFIDELEVSPGEMHAGPLFSLPSTPRADNPRGRYILRVTSLSSTPDYAYGTGVEYMAFDSHARPLLYLQAPYAKFLPITLNGRPQLLIMMRALDRHNRAIRWEPEWVAEDTASYQPETAQVTLNISYETFLILSEMRQGLPSLHLDGLSAAAGIAEQAGYIPEVFQAEILNRLGSCLFFLPMAIFIIVIGWRLRARYHPRYLFVILLPILPVIFNSVVHLYRSMLNTVGISLIFAVGFSSALAIFIVAVAVTFILSLILLAAQHD